MSGHDRRGFFGELLRSVARVGAEVDEALGSFREQPPPPPDDEEVVEVVDAPPAESEASLDDLTRLCDELGRGDWATGAAAAASVSIRLTHASGERGSYLGGPAPLPAGQPWPAAGGEPLTLVLCLALDELGPLPFAARGSLLLFGALDEPQAARIVLAPPGAPLASEGIALPRVPLEASRELVLPAVPREPDLDPTDLETWTRLRARLAQLQGVELEEQSPHYHALHRLLGEPDLVAHTMDEEAAHSLPGTAPADWRLLLQVSSDPAAGLRLPAYERLHVWAPAADVAAARFDRCRAFVG